MDEFVLQESTGYMAPALRFLSVFHTVISLLCLFGYYCLKVGAVTRLACHQLAAIYFFADDPVVYASHFFFFFLFVSEAS